MNMSDFAHAIGRGGMLLGGNMHGGPMGGLSGPLAPGLSNLNFPQGGPSGSSLSQQQQQQLAAASLHQARISQQQQQQQQHAGGGGGGGSVGSGSSSGHSPSSQQPNFQSVSQNQQRLNVGVNGPTGLPAPMRGGVGGMSGAGHMQAQRSQLQLGQSQAQGPAPPASALSSHPFAAALSQPPSSSAAASQSASQAANPLLNLQHQAVGFQAQAMMKQQQQQQGYANLSHSLAGLNLNGTQGGAGQTAAAQQHGMGQGDAQHSQSQGGPRFDLSDFPALSDISDSNKMSGGGGSSGPSLSGLNQPQSQPDSSFVIQNEDFPALGGSSTRRTAPASSPTSAALMSSSAAVPPTAAALLQQRAVGGSAGPIGQTTPAAGSTPPTSGVSMQQAGPLPMSGPPRGPMPRPSKPQTCERYGLTGLLSVIRMTDPDLTTLALGTDLTTLGLNLNSSEVLYATFASPALDVPTRSEPDYVLPYCFAENDTRVLTNQGFLFLAQIEKRLRAGRSLLYAAYDVSRKQLVYVPGRLVLPPNVAKKLVNFTSADEQQRWRVGGSKAQGEATSSAHLSLRVTPNHEMLVQEGQAQSDRSSSSSISWQRMGKVPASQLLSSCTQKYARFFTCAEQGVAQRKETQTQLQQEVARELGLDSSAQFDSFLQLYGFWLGTGSLHDHSLSFSLQRHHHSYLSSLLSACGLSRNEWRLEGSSCRVTNQRWVQFFNREYGTEAVLNEQNMSLMSWMLPSCDLRQSRLLLSGLRHSSSSPAAQSLFTSSPLLRDQLSMLLMHAGFSPFFQQQQQQLETGGKSSHGWLLHWSDPSLSEDESACQPQLQLSRDVSEESYDGRVWCVNLQHADHILVAQRALQDSTGSVLQSSRPVLAGNCYYMQPPALKTSHLAKFTLETLFYIFYNMPEDTLQVYAAKELYKREWRYHKELKLWFSRAADAKKEAAAKEGKDSKEAAAAASDANTYLYFDINAWEKRIFRETHMLQPGKFMTEEELAAL